VDERQGRAGRKIAAYEAALKSAEEGGFKIPDMLKKNCHAAHR
jgi:hypothetical protein